LGEIARIQGDLITAAQRYQSALEMFQRFQEPKTEAVVWHQLGMVYQEGKDLTAAEQAYRESASIQEQQGNMIGAANTYGQLAILNEHMERLSEAEQWYWKALQCFQDVGDQLNKRNTLHNLANLLAKQLNRLPEAHQLATAALAILETLDPAAAGTWTIYNLLAEIATAQNEPDKAKEYRHLARTTKEAFAGTQYELQQHAQLIELVAAAVGDEAAREQLEPKLVQLVEIGRGQMVAAIRQVLAGEREVEALWDDLDLDDSMIIAAILRGV
jgi:tetratricopeptide (TPR) repeat protein